MRVLWLSPGFPGDEDDLNCLPPLQLLAQALLAQGLELEIITLGYPFHNKPYRWHGIPLISGYGFNRQWVRWMNWCRVLHYARKAHRRQKFDLIHSFWLGPNWLIGQYLQARWKVPHFTTLMGQDVLPANGYLHFLGKHHLSGLVAVSEFQNDRFENTCGKRAAHTIPWGVIRTEIPVSLPDHRPLDVLGCGAFIPLKNWGLWLEVIAAVVKQQPDLRVELIGAGEDRAVIENKISQSGLEHIVHLTGHLPRMEVFARMQQARVFLHTANFESFGMVLAEAAMHGCRVLSTPVGIAPQISVTGQTAEALAEQMLAALDKPPLKSPYTPLTMEETAQQYLKLYHSRQTHV
jgi:glycosyltransferase involved in cell wall biosynthesis